MSTFTQQVATQVLPVVATVAYTALLGLLGIAGKWMTDHAKSQRVKDILGRVCGAADAAVRDVSNTMLEDLKKNGVLTPEARAKLKQEAEDKIRTTLGSVTVDGLRSTLGFASDAEMIAFLQTQVESAVFRMKIQKLSATAAAPVAPLAAPAVS
jgi:hypothetical protein